MNRQELARVLSVCGSSHCVGSVKECVRVCFLNFHTSLHQLDQKTGNVSKELSRVKRFNCSNVVISHFILQTSAVQAVFY